MKRVWKPAGMMGLRFYKVVVSWPGTTMRSRQDDQLVVAAASPREAAAIVAAQYAELPADRRPDCYGRALNINQPAEWWEGITPQVSPSTCKHERITSLQGGSGTCADGKGGGETWRENVALCLECGQLSVSATRNGQHFNVQFGLNCDQHLRAAARYMRSEVETKDAIERATKTES